MSESIAADRTDLAASRLRCGRHRSFAGGAASPAAWPSTPCRRQRRRRARTSTLVKIEDVRIEQRGEDVLHHDQQVRSRPRARRRETAADAPATSRISRTTPTMPHCTATLSVWLCGLAMTWSAGCWSAGRGLLEQPADRAGAVPMSGASEMNRSDFCQNSSRRPDRRRDARSLLVVVGNPSRTTWWPARHVRRGKPEPGRPARSSRQRGSGWFAASGAAAQTRASMIGMVTMRRPRDDDERHVDEQIRARPRPAPAAGQIRFDRSRVMTG